MSHEGLKAIVVIPEGKIALGKLSQVVMKLFLLKETLMRLLEIVKEIVK